MIAEQLAELIGAEQITADADLLAAYRFDRWCLKHWQDWQGHALDTQRVWYDPATRKMCRR